MWCRYLLLIFVLDFNECANNTDNCDVNAYCNNTVGFYNCTCYPEYTGNGTSCTVKFLDNTLSFTIFCCYWNATRVPNVVFWCLNSKVCMSFIWCLGRPSFCPHVLNLFWTVILKWPEILKQLSYWNVSLQNLFYFFFSDFDECANNTDDCDVNAYCNNTVGSFNCTCNSGYTGNGTACAGKYDYFILDRSSSIYFSYIAQSNRPVGSFSLEIKTN